ncbi:hypothetical protein ACIGXM_20810 [Kitasatospora sp. NPDC052896]|uniref:hypothetical protein n=1 Tax=Kitasatospora sp. NPDC052896 TaxID=3364061 RepID=UPI0037C5129C
MAAARRAVLRPSGSCIQGGDLDGPWDLTATDQGSTATLYVTDTLHGIQAVGQAVQQAGLTGAGS